MRDKIAVEKYAINVYIYFDKRKRLDGEERLLERIMEAEEKVQGRHFQNSSALSTLMSVLIGILSGYIGGKLDLLVQRFVDTWMCLPSLVVLMVIMSIIGPGLWSIIFVLGITRGIGGSRIIRSAVIGFKENVYVKAGVAIGCPTYRIILRHILPNIMSVTIILFSVRVPAIVLTEASLSFLGFGIPAPFPSWGGMLSGAGRMYMYEAPWLMIWPGLALAIVVYGINMFGDAARDIMDPRLKGGVGRFGVKAESEPAAPAGSTEQGATAVLGRGEDPDSSPGTSRDGNERGKS